jgi:hypothetical protein
MKLDNLKVLVLMNQQILLAQIEEVTCELGEPDCKMTEPFILSDDLTLTLQPWLINVTTENTFMIHSDKILTITEPNSKLKDKYESLVK